jgi:RES domain-containing protein
MIVFRMHGANFGPFDTTGSLLKAGRWHSAGTRVIYAAQHVSLAVLETLIHAGGRKIPPRVLTRIHIPDDLLIESAKWVAAPGSLAFGDDWVAEARTAVLRVPSIAVNKLEFNFVFNPTHPHFSRVRHHPPQPFVFDPRFFAI